MKTPHAAPAVRGSWFLDWIEWLGNKLPDPAVLFVFALFITWGASAWLAPVETRDDTCRALDEAAF